jgi:hypothetical protein
VLVAAEFEGDESKGAVVSIWPMERDGRLEETTTGTVESGAVYKIDARTSR